ncbi:hypothetical protein EDB83DRAFT_2317873 [Lactarius deliciosus]|nr:hypothetical protein EDB83DRAFT_2317873 [Lactarius deliciosus]
MLRRDRRGLLVDATAQAQPKRQYFYATACSFNSPKVKLELYDIVAVLRPGIGWYFLEQNAAGREGAIEDMPADLGMGLVRKYCFAVTKYPHALMDPYRIDGPVGSGPIIRSHHSLEYSRQTGNTIMEVCHSVAPTPGAYFLESAFFVSICKDLTSRWPKLWDLTERGHLSYANSTGAGHQIPSLPTRAQHQIRRRSHTCTIALFGLRVITCACGVLIPVSTKFVAADQSGPRRYVRGPEGPGRIPANNLKARSWGMDQFDGQGPPIARPGCHPA